jgi:hypothetical protein
MHAHPRKLSPEPTTAQGTAACYKRQFRTIARNKYRHSLHLLIDLDVRVGYRLAFKLRVLPGFLSKALTPLL